MIKMAKYNWLQHRQRRRRNYTRASTVNGTITLRDSIGIQPIMVDASSVNIENQNLEDAMNDMNERLEAVFRRLGIIEDTLERERNT